MVPALGEYDHDVAIDGPHHLVKVGKRRYAELGRDRFGLGEVDVADGDELCALNGAIAQQFGMAFCDATAAHQRES
ncbi:hypothetical protein D3C87_1793700 [compost metagenome]